jgi:peptidoglycan/LPS O-acetylase OafA/YrhL
MDTLVAPAATTKTHNRLYYPALDGLRFLAFAIVFIHHHELFKHIPYLTSLHKNGWIGVDLFFILSAFLFTRLLIEEYRKTGTINYRKFYIRRIFRIWPVYYLFVAFCFIYYLKINPISQTGLLRLAGLCTFTDNIISVFQGYSPIAYTPHLWTIGFEEQFYIFVPLLIYTLIRIKNKWVWIISSVVFLNLIRAVFIAQDVPHPAIWVLPITHFDSIALGIVIGFGGFDTIFRKINPAILGLIGIALFICLEWMTPVEDRGFGIILTYTVVGLCTSFILYSVLTIDFLKKVFSNRVIVFLGKRSYGLYLFHLFCNGMAEVAVRKSWIPSGYFFSFIFSLGITIILSILSYKLIETPFLRLKKKYEVIASRPI